MIHMQKLYMNDNNKHYNRFQVKLVNILFIIYH